MPSHGSKSFMSLVKCILKSAISFHVSKMAGLFVPKNSESSSWLHICKRFDWWKHLYYVQNDTRNPPTDPLNLDLNSVESLWYQTWSVTSRLAQRKDSHSFPGSLWAQKHSRIEVGPIPFSIPSSRFLTKTVKFPSPLNWTSAWLCTNFGQLQLSPPCTS